MRAFVDGWFWIAGELIAMIGAVSIIVILILIDILGGEA